MYIAAAIALTKQLNKEEAIKILKVDEPSSLNFSLSLQIFFIILHFQTKAKELKKLIEKVRMQYSIAHIIMRGEPNSLNLSFLSSVIYEKSASKLVTIFETIVLPGPMSLTY